MTVTVTQSCPVWGVVLANNHLGPLTSILVNSKCTHLPMLPLETKFNPQTIRFSIMKIVLLRCFNTKSKNKQLIYFCTYTYTLPSALLCSVLFGSKTLMPWNVSYGDIFQIIVSFLNILEWCNICLSEYSQPKSGLFWQFLLIFLHKNACLYPLTPVFCQFKYKWPLSNSL